MHRHVLPVLGQQVLQSLAHLRGGPAGEGDGQTLRRRHAAFRHQVGNTVRQSTGLARAGPGNDEQWPARMLCSSALLGVEAGEDTLVRRRRRGGLATCLSLVVSLCLGYLFRPLTRRGPGEILPEE